MVLIVVGRAQLVALGHADKTYRQIVPCYKAARLRAVVASAEPPKPIARVSVQIFALQTALSQTVIEGKPRQVQIVGVAGRVAQVAVTQTQVG